MKIYELIQGSILVQNLKSEKIYLKFEDCDGIYGKFIEISKNNEELISKQPKYIYYACYASLDELKLTLIKKEKNIKKFSFFSFLDKIIRKKKD